VQATTHHVGVRAQVYTGADVLDRLAERLDDLHAATGTPVTARRPWLAAWVRSYRDQEPVAVVVEDPDGRLEGAALLARRRGLGMTRVVAMGHGPSDEARLPVRSILAAEALGEALADFLTSQPRPWRLVLRHLRQDDPVIPFLAARLRHVRLVPGSVSLVTRFDADRDLSTYVSRNHRHVVKKMHKRILREGLSVDIAHVRTPGDVAAVVDEVETVCYARDVQARGWSALENSSAGPFFRQVILDHADRGEVELTTLRLDGELAAYALCFVDGGAHRLWNGRVAPSWLRYGAGGLANNAALEHALSDPDCTAFDWMLGDESYKRSMANHVERTRDALAWSSLTLELVTDAPRRLKALFIRAAERHPAVDRVLPHARRLYQEGRRLRRRLAADRDGEPSTAPSGGPGGVPRRDGRGAPLPALGSADVQQASTR
jgi:CelD/BcsL family acetyltransferase involved in cellulose biosynthesis